MVIDTGMVREMHYDERRRLSCLVTQWISRASSKQVLSCYDCSGSAAQAYLLPLVRIACRR